MARIDEQFALFVQTTLLTPDENMAAPFFTNAPNSIELSKLPISKAVRKLELSLQDYLVAFANTITNQAQTNVSMVALQKDLIDTLELYARQIYWLGVVYVAAFFEIKPKSTERDDDNIDNIVNDIEFSVWKRAKEATSREILIEDEKQAKALQDALKNGSTPKVLKPIFKPKQHKPLNLDKQLKGLATVLATNALNIATIDKTRQVVEGIQKGEIISLTKQFSKRVLTPQQIQKFAQADALADLQLSMSDDPSVFLSLNYVMWITAEDERVCYICSQLQGQFFLLSDPTMPIPKRDTHDNCRCRLLLTDPIFDEQNRNDQMVFAV